MILNLTRCQRATCVNMPGTHTVMRCGIENGLSMVVLGLIRRYRECKQCHHNYVTHERLAIYAGKSRGFVEDCPAACG